MATSLRLSKLVTVLVLCSVAVGVSSIEAQFRSDVCGSGSFACNNGACVLLSEKCNGKDDCGDGSDEQGCSRCDAPKFQCPNGACLEDVKPCDGVRDCVDGSDENVTFCASHRCAAGYFRCSEGYRCIVSHLVCDGRPQCPDGSDELQDCPPTVDVCQTPNSFNCSTFCIESEEVCNGIRDCDDGRDELDCTARESVFTCSAASKFTCSRSRQCVELSERCNEVEDCEYGEDEEGCDRSSSITSDNVVVEPCAIAGEFRCGSRGPCLPSELRCDGSADCHDASDEAGCPPRDQRMAQCPADELTCRAVGSEPPRCVPLSRRCDKFTDCPLGDDEADCSPIVVPPVDIIDSDPVFLCDKATQFLCASTGTCIDKATRCNDYRDCPNGEDEEGCQLDDDRDPCSPTNIGSCEQLCVAVPSRNNATGGRQRYTCGCVQGFRLVGPHACADIDECSNGTSQCSQRCENSPGSFRCSCVEQYTLDPLDMRTCRANGEKLLFVLFRDELRELRLARLPNAAYSRIYEADSTQARAVASGNSKNASLSQIVKHVEVISTSVTADRQLIRNISFATAFDFDVTLDLVFWSSQTRSAGNRRKSGLYMSNWEVHALIRRQEEQLRRRISDMMQEKFSPIAEGDDAADEPVSEKMKRLRQAEATQKEIIAFMKQLQANASSSIPRNLTITLYEDAGAKIEAVAFDWLNRLIYWTDSQKKHIAALSQLTGRWVPVVTDGLESPRAIALDPEHGTMYFSDCADNNAFIHSAGMDGSDRVPILDSSRVVWPNALTVDYASRRLYFVDAKLAKIGSCLLDVAPSFIGSTCTWMFADPEAARLPTLMYSMTVFEDHIFWADNRRGAVRTCNRFSCNDTLRTLVANRNDVHAVSMAHALRQPNAGSSGGYCLAIGQRCPYMCLPRRLERGANTPNARCVCDVGDRFTPGSEMLTGTCSSDPDFRKPSVNQVNVDVSASDKTQSKQDTAAADALETDEPNDVGRVAIIVICTLLGVVFVAVLVAVLVYRNYAKRNVKSMNFDNPVYRRTTAAQHYFAPGVDSVVNVTPAYALGDKNALPQTHTTGGKVSINSAADSARYVASPSRRPAGAAADPSETHRLTDGQTASTQDV